jgi:hypothetical protein
VLSPNGNPEQRVLRCMQENYGRHRHNNLYVRANIERQFGSGDHDRSLFLIHTTCQTTSNNNNIIIIHKQYRTTQHNTSHHSKSSLVACFASHRSRQRQTCNKTIREIDESDTRRTSVPATPHDPDDYGALDQYIIKLDFLAKPQVYESFVVTIVVRG